MSQVVPSPDQVCIYALASSDKPHLVRYIGKTERGLSVRLPQHIRERHRRKSPKNDWLSSLIKRGLKPVIWPIEICSSELWEEREKFWISFFKPILLNVSLGGDTGPSRKGCKMSQEAKIKIGIASKKRGLSPLFLLKREQYRGTKHTEEAKRNMSISRKGILPPRKAVENAILKTKGVPKSEEFRKKVSAGQRVRFSRKGEIERLRDSFSKSRFKIRRVICVETGDIFPNHRIASQWVGGAKNGVYMAFSRKGLSYGKCRGLTFKYLD